jgi:hypothetical protein
LNPTFYRLDSTRLTYGECWWGSPNAFLALILCLLRFLHVPVRIGSDDPNVEKLAPFEVDFQGLPEDVQQRFRPALQELELFGFRSPIFHSIDIGFSNTWIYVATLRHVSGRTCGRLHYRIFKAGSSKQEAFYRVLMSRFAEGGYLITSGWKRDLQPPENWVVTYHPAASLTDLWDYHEGEIEKIVDRTIVPVADIQLQEFAEAHHAQVRDHHVSRGFFAPLQSAPPKLSKVLVFAAGLCLAAVLMNCLCWWDGRHGHRAWLALCNLLRFPLLLAGIEFLPWSIFGLGVVCDPAGKIDPVGNAVDALKGVVLAVLFILMCCLPLPFAWTLWVAFPLSAIYLAGEFLRHRLEKIDLKQAFLRVAIMGTAFVCTWFLCGSLSRSALIGFGQKLDQVGSDRLQGWAKEVLSGPAADPRFPSKDVPDFVDDLMGGPGWARYSADHSTGCVTIINGGTFGFAVELCPNGHNPTSRFNLVWAEVSWKPGIILYTFTMNK